MKAQDSSISAQLVVGYGFDVVAFTTCGVSFGRMLSAEKSRSSFGASIMLGWGVFLLLALAGRSPSFCTGYSRCLSLKSGAARAAQKRPASNLQRRGPNPRVLTSKISSAESAAKILELVGREVDGEVFNDFHMSAAFTRLAKLSRERKISQTDAGSPVWPRLVSRLRGMLQKNMLPPRGLANVFWASNELFNKVPGCNEEMVLELVTSVQENASAMNAQALSNCMLVAAKLGDAGQGVLSCVKSIVEHMPANAKDLKPQELSNSLWAAAKLQDAAPEVRKCIPAISQRILDKVEGMKPQELANSLWAAATLQHAASEVLIAVPAISQSIPDKVRGMNSQELRTVCGQLQNCKIQHQTC